MGPDPNDDMHPGDKVTIPKLADDGSNWIDYRDRVVWLLESQNIDEHIDNDTVPSSYTNGGNVGGLMPEQRWKKEETTIKQVIGPSLPRGAFARIKGQKTVHGVWVALKQVYEEKTRALAADLMQRFRNTRCGENDNLRTHFEHLGALKEQLAGMGKLISDEDYANIILASLPSSYDSDIASISNSAKLGSKALTADLLQDLILDEYTRRELRKPQPSNSKDEAFVAEASNGKSKKRCNNCNKRGHFKADCWAKGGGKEGQGPKKNKDKGSESAVVAEEEKVEAWMVIEDAEENTEVEVASAAGTLPAQTERVRGTATELYDSGATRHMSPSHERFTTYRRIEPIPIKAANKGVFYAVGTGDLRVEVPDGESSTPITLKDVLYAPDLSHTVISINLISVAGYSVTFEDCKCIIKDKRRDTVIGTIPVSSNGLYKVEHAYAAVIAPERVSLATLHRRLAHIGPHAIRALVRRGAVEGVELTDDNTLFTCDSCEQAKSTRKPIRKEREEPIASSFGEEVHSDVWGPSPTLSMGKSKYYITFTDDFSRYTRLTTMRTKDGALQAYKDYAAWAHTQHGARIKRLHSDRGGEYTRGEFTSFLREQGTERRLTTHDTPQHNGVAESLNRHLVERMRALLHQSSLPKSLWAEALHFVVWVKNRTLTKVLGNVTPYERLTGRKPNLAGVPEWGQQVWVHTAGNPKLDPRAAMAHWVGYDADSTHAHRIYWPGQQKVSVERDVRFTDSSTTMSIPASVLAPAISAPTTPAPSATPTISAAPLLSTGSTPSTPAQVVSTPQLPPATTDSGEEEIEVEDELTDAPPSTTRKKKSKTKAAAQPTRQSARLHAKRIASREGMVDRVT